MIWDLIDVNLLIIMHGDATFTDILMPIVLCHENKEMTFEKREI